MKIQARDVLIAGAAALVGLLLSGQLIGLWEVIRGDDEKGINVKNGSVELITTKGWEEHGQGYRTIGKTKECYTVVAGSAACTGDATHAFRAISIWSKDGNNEKEHQGASHQVFLGKRSFKLADRNGWWLSSDRLTLMLARGAVSRLEARDGASAVSCTFGSGADATLVPTDCD